MLGLTNRKIEVGRGKFGGPCSKKDERDQFVSVLWEGKGRGDFFLIERGTTQSLWGVASFFCFSYIPLGLKNRSR